jgi:long-chain acyl-CoA synthetase
VRQDRNLARLGEQTLQRLGDRDALFFEDRWFRAAELHQRGVRVAQGLVELGIEGGDRVAVMMSNSPDVGVLYSAIWRAGGAVTPAIFLLSEPELRNLLADSQAVAVVTSPEFLDKVRSAAAGLPSVRWIVCAGCGDDVVDLDALAAAPPGPIVERDDSDLAALMYTGGTTGRAKGVMLSHANLWEAGHSTHEAASVAGVTRALIPLPLSHAFGLLVTVTGLHADEPGVAVLQRWFEPESFLRLIEAHRVQTVPTVPSMLQVLLAMPLENYDLTSLRYVSSGAAPLARELAEELERRLPGVEVREGYGLTESGGIATASPPGLRRRGSVGLPVPGTEVRIVDSADRPLPPGESGEICIRSRTVMAGYWRAPDATREALRGGWLHTGDIGHLDEDGYLYISDRVKDLIIRGGFNVFPRDVEDALLEHGAVAAAAVVGRPDERLGEEVVAFVALRPGVEATAEELLAFARERLGAHKYAREIRIVDTIPLTAVGKVDRKQLRSEVQAPVAR